MWSKRMTIGFYALMVLMVIIFAIVLEVWAEEGPVDWQLRALEAEARLEITESKRLIAVEIGQACEDRMGTLIAQGRKDVTNAALKALQDYRKVKAALEARKPEPKEDTNDKTKVVTDEVKNPGS